MTSNDRNLAASSLCLAYALLALWACAGTTPERAVDAGADVEDVGPDHSEAALVNGMDVAAATGDATAATEVGSDAASHETAPHADDANPEVAVDTGAETTGPTTGSEVGFDAGSDAIAPPVDGGADSHPAEDLDASDVDGSWPEIVNVWPPETSPGSAVLVAGQNFAKVSAALIAGQPAVVSVVDVTPGILSKVIVTVPADAGFSPDAGLTLVTSAGKAANYPAFAVHAPETPVLDVVGPTNVFVPVPPPPSFYSYPPISDTWTEDCNPTVTFFLSQVADDGVVIFFDGPDDSTLQGSFDRSTRLFRLIDEGTEYVGVYSQTDMPTSSARLVLFPTTSPGSQLTLVVCFGEDAPTCEEGPDGGFLSDAGPACPTGP